MKINVTNLSAPEIVALSMRLTQAMGVSEFAIDARGDSIWLRLIE